MCDVCVHASTMHVIDLVQTAAGFVPDSSPGAGSYFSPASMEAESNETFEVLFSAQRNPVIAGLDAEIARNPFRHRSRSSFSESSTHKRECAFPADLLGRFALLRGIDGSEIRIGLLVRSGSVLQHQPCARSRPTSPSSGWTTCILDVAVSRSEKLSLRRQSCVMVLTIRLSH